MVMVNYVIYVIMKYIKIKSWIRNFTNWISEIHSRFFKKKVIDDIVEDNDPKTKSLVDKFNEIKDLKKPTCKNGCSYKQEEDDGIFLHYKCLICGKKCVCHINSTDKPDAA